MTENKWLMDIRQKRKKGKESRPPTGENIKVNQMLYGILLHYIKNLFFFFYLSLLGKT